MSFLERLLPAIIAGLAQKDLKRAEVQAAAVGDEFPVKGVAHGVRIWGRRFEVDLTLKVSK